MQCNLKFFCKEVKLLKVGVDGSIVGDSEGRFVGF